MPISHSALQSIKLSNFARLFKHLNMRECFLLKNQVKLGYEYLFITWSYLIPTLPKVVAKAKFCALRKAEKNLFKLKLYL